ncbi:MULTISPECIES: recombinase family protein [Sphingomonas]|uniref:recombinase family protein n=1 Tax=Sphingomonas TaxID=13687 RepID=UPI0013B452A5|nr:MULTISPECIES: recombinase family protein [Sphingomonas]
MRKLRCAVYTRKSTEEGLEQDFNSLDAQYEACAAYVSSQRHEGWTLVRERYDDGGFSGGTLERPGLKRLLADVEARKVDVIVVYKVDRLTRALSDFARIVDVLDSRDASFVSITQSFNTTTSMGRLTLNVLLSFAQFEREVIAERVRDKVAASRRKGIWMGGSPPLGYEVQDRKLVVNDVDAATVRHIFRRYVELGCGSLLLAELRREEIKTKARAGRGGVHFGRGSIYYLLTNRSYLGEARHKTNWYPGEHSAIIGPELWAQVQAKLVVNRVSQAREKAKTRRSVLAGILYDQDGRRMVPSHTKRRGRAYRYYVTDQSFATPAAPALRVPAWDVEQAVLSRVRSFLSSNSELKAKLGIECASELSRVAASAEIAGGRLQENIGPEKLIGRVELTERSLTIGLRGDLLADTLNRPSECAGELILWARVSRVRRGKEIKLVLGEGAKHTEPQSQLLSVLREAAEAKRLIDSSAGVSLSAIAAKAGRCRANLAALYRIAHLSPEIVVTILDAACPTHLTKRALLAADLPANWTEQQRLLFRN